MEIPMDHSLDAHWSQWKEAHGKLYDKDEEGWRRTVWERNMEMIEQHNQEYSQGEHSFTLAMNAFGDMVTPVFAEISSSVDWREQGYVIPVKDQGPCESRWAFNTTDAWEGQTFHKTGKLVSLSNEGCSGGLVDNSFQYVKDNGGLDGSCKYRPEYPAANVTDFVNILQQEESLMVSVATVGPVSIGINASLDTFWSIKKGTDWGMQGCILIAKDQDNHWGSTTRVSIPVV
ncbi:unnamed protein product [Nyctereutes procyonoides]|uniref:(raccoon dog) hypothetical protein n=1 Tax=Nyctereutes procyonoides TaxID=34880 RepID=A0A811ZT01_NYCPR|nr:unnamed protein product [Nyctereutes procyonoides]